MEIRRKRFIIAFINVLIILMAFFLRYGGITFKIGQAVPILLIPIVISISIFFGENATLLAALLAGVLMDSASADTSIFNTMFLLISSTACSVMANRLLNRNLKAAVCLSAGFSFGYFAVKYLIFYVFGGVSVNYDYFVYYFIPSVLYTAVWIIPFYFLERKLSNY